MTTRSPKVSIGLPVFNAERFLQDTLDSLLAQSFTDTEIVISDNASTDSTQEICLQLQRDDPRIHYFRNERNLGVTANYNRVAELSRGVYFKWASANDRCHTDYIAECVEVLDSLPDVVLCHARCRLLKDDGTEEDYEGDFEVMESRPSERWMKVLTCLRLNNLLNGVVRRSTLLRTTMLGPYIWSDTTTIAELSLYGKFYMLPDVRFYRNMEQSAATAQRRDSEVLTHFEPERVGKLQFREWRRLYEFAWGAARAPIPLSEKLPIARSLLRQAYWGRRTLLQEVLFGMNRLGAHTLGRQPED